MVATHTPYAVGDIKVYSGSTWPTLLGKSLRIMGDAIVSASGEIAYRCKVSVGHSVTGPNFFIVAEELQ